MGSLEIWNPKQAAFQDSSAGTAIFERHDLALGEPLPRIGVRKVQRTLGPKNHRPYSNAAMRSSSARSLGAPTIS